MYYYFENGHKIEFDGSEHFYLLIMTYEFLKKMNELIKETKEQREATELIKPMEKLQKFALKDLKEAKAKAHEAGETEEAIINFLKKVREVYEKPAKSHDPDRPRQRLNYYGEY